MITFKYIPAADDTVDAEFECVGGSRNVSIQVCPYGHGYTIIECGVDDPSDENSFWMMEHGETTDLNEAKKIAAKVAA
jgi:hypothetical protein